MNKQNNTEVEIQNTAFSYSWTSSDQNVYDWAYGISH